QGQLRRHFGARAWCGQGVLPSDVRHRGADLRSTHATDHPIAIRCRATAIEAAKFESAGTAHRRGLSNNCQFTIHSTPSPNEGLQNPILTIIASPPHEAKQAVLQLAHMYMSVIPRCTNTCSPGG